MHDLKLAQPTFISSNRKLVKYFISNYKTSHKYKHELRKSNIFKRFTYL